MTVPASAERIDGMPSLTAARGPSRFLPGQETFRPTFTCSSCKRIREPRPKNDVPFRCDGCGLSMQIESLDLFVWRDEPATA